MKLDDIHGYIYRPGDPQWPSCYQTAVSAEPDLLIEAEDAADVQRAVAYAAENELPIAARNTGHGATSFTGGVLISTRRLQRVDIDPHARLARVGGGTTWDAVVREAARYGLAPLSGSAPTVGVAGYSLGGGIGPLTRQYGYAADHVTGLDVVTADGRPRRVSADNHADLYWAMRGGGGSFGVVTALQFRLFPVDQVLAGALSFDPERFPEIVSRYREWTTVVPDQLTSSLSLMTFPDLPTLPERIRGKRTLRLFVTCTDPRTCISAIDALRTWGPVEDTISPMPYAECSKVFAEPATPHGYQGDAVTTAALDPTAAATVMERIDAETENCVFLQLHHLGGAAARQPEHENAIGHRDATYVVRVTTPVARQVPGDLASKQSALIQGLAHGATSRALNFLFGDNAAELRTSACYEPETYQRLVNVKRRYDPANLIRLGRAISVNAR
jgi:hypothetical protein